MNKIQNYIGSQSTWSGSPSFLRDEDLTNWRLKPGDPVFDPFPVDVGVKDLKSNMLILFEFKSLVDSFALDERALAYIITIFPLA